jgi:hypothetical protein
VVDEVILVEAVGECEVLFELPFMVTTTGDPIRYVAFSDDNAELVECSDDVLIRDTVREHATDHVARGFGEAGNATVAAGFADLQGLAYGFGINDGWDLGWLGRLERESGAGVEEVLERGGSLRFGVVEERDAFDR